MRRVLIAIVTGGLVLAGIPGCFEAGSSEQSVSSAELDSRSSTPVAFDLFGAKEDANAHEENSAPVEHAVFWRTESNIPEAQPTGIPTSFADLAERVAPAVVSIQTRGTVDLGEQQVLPPGLEEFFGGGPFGPHGGGGRKHKSSGEGSGFVISADGFVVTNNHVVENMDEITVRFLDGKELEAKIVGRDPKTDIALLKVDPKENQLKTIALGDSDAIRAGVLRRANLSVL